MEDFDYRMNEICQNIINYIRELAANIDTNKDMLKSTEITFQVALATCGYNSDELIAQQEEDLEIKVEEMKK